MSPIDVTLSCIIINTQRRILHPPFTLKVPVQAGHTIIYSFLRSAAPTLRNQDNSKFRLYTPLVHIPFYHGHEGVLDEAQVNLAVPIGRPSVRITSIFPNEQRGGKDRGVDAIICICMNDQRGQDTVQIDLDKAAQGPQDLLTVTLDTEASMTQPKQSHMPTNFVEKVSHDSLMPDFLKKLEEKLTARRAPVLWTTTPNYLQLVKDILGNNLYEKHFEDSSTRPTLPLEFLHYYEILSDEQICRFAAFNANKEHHVYCLLRRLTSGLEGQGIMCFNESWPVSLILQTPDGSFPYTPRSDFHITVNEFPVLLLEVGSDPDNSDQRRMQLQAACLVRLGNALNQHESLDFFIKGIYIDSNYHAYEHTFYEDSSRPSNQVVYRTDKFDLTKPVEAFKFIFRFYNFLGSQSDISKQFAQDSSLVYSFVRQMNAKQKTAASRTSRGRSGGTPQTTSNQGRSAPEGSRVRAFVQARGYKLSSGDVQSTVIKATKHGHVVALKPLFGPGAKNELEILEYLQIDSPQNHTIQLYDVIRSNSLGDILVMPWKTPLDACLKMTPMVAESLQYQLLEGVWFLHEHGIAHLDLKPDNLLIRYMHVSSSLPRLSIIDYGVSTHVKGEGTLLESYRGTRDWSAPEVEDGPGTGTPKKYSAVLADRWSCGRVLWYIGQKRQVNNTSTFTSISNRLLSPDPRSRPPLGPILDDLRVMGVVKRDNGTDSEFVSQKRPRRSVPFLSGA